MYQKTALLPLAVLFLILYACADKSAFNDNKEKKSALFRLLHPDSTLISFNNSIEENELFNLVDYFYVYNGGGVAIGDINNDSLPDIFFTGNMVADALFLNQGELKFKEITSSSLSEIKEGWSTGVTMVDINHDGYLDIYVCRSGNFAKEKRKNLLYINRGDMTFIEQAEKFGLADTGYSTQAAFFDYDKDGDLDMYLLNHTNAIRDPNNIRPLVSDGTGLANDRLYRNDEEKGLGIKFTETTIQAGINYDGLGLGLSIADINGDGWEDIFVTNDFLANDYIYINQKNGTFKEMAKSYLKHMSHFSMGNDIADFNNDGLVDLITVDMRPKDNFHEKKMSGPLNFDLFEKSLQQGYLPQYMRNTLQLNNGSTKENAQFSEIGQISGIDATDWSWSPLFADFDNDGFKDLYITNGYLRDITDLDFINYTSTLSDKISNDSLDTILKQKAQEMPSIKLSNYMFKNTGKFCFDNVTEKWALDNPTLSNGAAYSDLDNDGDLDIIINNINEVASIYENLSRDKNQNHYLSIQLKGDSLNLSGIGAEVRLFQPNKAQLSRQALTRGYQSSTDNSLHFGLGSNAQIDSIVVTWPTGNSMKITNVMANRHLVIYPHSGTKVIRKNTCGEEMFTEVTSTLNLNTKHGERVYHDFNRAYLLPHKLSEQGPGIAVGDLNGDGYEDFFMGGGYNNSGQIFLGSKTGRFQKKLLVSNENEKYEEDTGVLLFDYDNDDDLDLYIASGSNEFHNNSEYYQDRLYKNDGKGNFVLTKDILPTMLTSTSCVRASDFDGDGDWDLFVGGRLTPLKYPLPSNSYLLLNEGGKFSDATNKLAPSLRKPGMVTDALWTDYDTDGDTDLIVVGEFMALEFFRNKSGKLINDSHDTGLKYTSGWWNSINAGDFDNDGDMDYIVGNLGLNSKYKASANEPISIYALDYDQNGSIDPIMTSYTDGKEHPVHSRDDLIKQIPSLKKKFPDYASYARATISDVLSVQEKSNAYSAKVFKSASSILINQGDGKFVINPLPPLAQLAPVYGISVKDFDNDGNLDILISGNDYGTEVSLGRYDASKGLYLKGMGTGEFLPISNTKSGLLIDGNSRGTASITTNYGIVHLFGSNAVNLKAYNLINEEKGNNIIPIPANDIRAKIHMNNGKIRMHEFYYGSSYLSQSTRQISLSGHEKKIYGYDVTGNEKLIFEQK